MWQDAEPTWKVFFSYDWFGCHWPQAAVSLLPHSPVRKSILIPGFHEHMHFVCALVTVTPYSPLASILVSD